MITTKIFQTANGTSLHAQINESGCVTNLLVENSEDVEKIVAALKQDMESKNEIDRSMAKGVMKLVEEKKIFIMVD